MKSILIEADSPQNLQEALQEFLIKEDENIPTETRDKLRNSFATQQILICKEIINVQQYITQVIEQNQFHPKLGSQKITYYLLIIYR